MIVLIVWAAVLAFALGIVYLLVIFLPPGW